MMQDRQGWNVWGEEGLKVGWGALGVKLYLSWDMYQGLIFK